MNYVYLLRCADDTLYGGWTNNLAHRLAAHNTGKTGAKYTKSRRPVTLVYCEKWDTRSEAMRREAAIKKLPRIEKEKLIASLSEEGDELLAVYDENRDCCGVLPRRIVHRCGLVHGVVQLYVFQEKEGVLGVWLQQRSLDKKASPGAYTWTVTGHIDAGECPRSAALREAREECGICLSAEEIKNSGEQRIITAREPDITDKEIAHLFFYLAEDDPPFCIGAEVQQMVWASAKAITETMQSGAPLPVCTQGGQTKTIAAEVAPKNREGWNRAYAAAQKAIQEKQDG